MLPCIDLESDDPRQIETLRTACRQWGAFYLIGHSVSTQQLHDALTFSSAFFNLSPAVKNRLRRTEKNSWGYNDAELTKNRRDHKEILDIGPAVTSGPLAGSFPQWPDLAGFTDCMQNLTAAMHETALRVVDLIGQVLAVDENLRAPFDHHSSFLRLNYYPTSPAPASVQASMQDPDGDLGISHHTDAGAATVLFTDDQPGLQLWRAGRWHTVTPNMDAAIINIGDIVQVWSNDEFRAPLHRVLANSRRTRISMPYFLNPDYAYTYRPLVSDPAPVYSPINWGEFRAKRSAGDYADVGEEVQISAYRVANSQS